MDKEEYLKFCKDRALRYLEQGDVFIAAMSLVSDISKHQDTRDSYPEVGTHLTILTPGLLREFIEGLK